MQQHRQNRFTESEFVDISRMSDRELQQRFEIPPSAPRRMKAARVPHTYPPGPQPRLICATVTADHHRYADFDQRDPDHTYRLIGVWRPSRRCFTLRSSHEPQLVREIIDILRRRHEKVFLRNESGRD